VNLGRVIWRRRKSSRRAEKHNRIEVATVLTVRDSKDPHGPVLTLTWQSYFAYIDMLPG
jgi:hypothetical protein